MLDVPGLEGTRAQESAPARPSDVAPAMVFDALVEERTGVAGEDLPARSPRSGAQRAQDTERRLRRAIAVVATALGIVVAALIGSVLANDSTTPVTSVSQGSSDGSTQPTSNVPPTDTPTTTAATSPTSTPPPTEDTATSTIRSRPLTAASPPVLTKLHPSSGVPGQSVEVSGSGFLSSSGRISATVGGRTASVRCPDQTTCTVKIPPQPGRRATDSVVVITDSGTSNPLAFTLR